MLLQKCFDINFNKISNCKLPNFLWEKWIIVTTTDVFQLDRQSRRCRYWGSVSAYRRLSHAVLMSRRNVLTFYCLCSGGDHLWGCNASSGRVSQRSRKHLRVYHPFQVRAVCSGTLARPATHAKETTRAFPISEGPSPADSLPGASREQSGDGWWWTFWNNLDLCMNCPDTCDLLFIWVIIIKNHTLQTSHTVFCISIEGPVDSWLC